MTVAWMTEGRIAFAPATLPGVEAEREDPFDDVDDDDLTDDDEVGGNEGFDDPEELDDLDDLDEDE